MQFMATLIDTSLGSFKRIKSVQNRKYGRISSSFSSFFSWKKFHQFQFAVHGVRTASRAATLLSFFIATAIGLGRSTYLGFLPIWMCWFSDRRSRHYVSLARMFSQQTVKNWKSDAALNAENRWKVQWLTHRAQAHRTCFGRPNISGNIWQPQNVQYREQIEVWMDEIDFKCILRQNNVTKCRQPTTDERSRT